MENLENYEVWKPIPNFVGYYEASNMGRIRSVPRVLISKQKYKGKVLKPKLHKFGYEIVNLSVDGIVKTAKVHRLVALAFLPNPKGYKTINHKDENKQNNRVENLEWCDMAYNNTYGTRIQRVVESNRHNSLCQPVAQMTLDGKIIRIFHSQNEAGRVLNMSQGNINNAVLGKSKTAYGYKWVSLK